MIITDDEAKDLKTWTIKKLENISDADSDVLADYVLAIIRADVPEPELRANAIENLEDFLKENTSGFIQDIFQAVHAKSYIPGYVAPAPQPIPSYTATPTQPGLGLGQLNFNPAFQQSRKRSFNESQEGPQSQDSHYRHGDRQMKQSRRGGMHNGGRNGSFSNSQGYKNNAPNQNFPGMPMPPAGMQMDPNDPMSAILAMQAMGIPLPGMDPQGFVPGANGQMGKNKVNARCRDYDTKGVCTRGVYCPFDHGGDQVFIPSSGGEYDPKSPRMTGFPGQLATAQNLPDSPGGRGRGRGRGDRGGFQQQRRNNRAEFSQTGPNLDRAITTVVVEHIPEENFDEGHVRDFFSQYGNITEVTMKAYKRLALIKFDNYDSARAAYESPKVIFDNRFVKVYWYKPDAASTPDGAKSNSQASQSAKENKPVIDHEKAARDAEEAQKKHDQRKELLKQNESQLAEIQKQKDELQRKQLEAKRKLEEKIKTKGGSATGPGTETGLNGMNGMESKKSADTEALRAQVKALEDEARSLGLDTSAAPERGRGRGRGRGSYRGWEGFRGGHDSSRGGYRGRGSFRGMPRGGGAYNLDNRPKAVRIEGVTFDDGKDESLKQHLFSIGEFTSIESSDSKSSQTVTFKDRKTAENFFYGTKDIPGVGKVEMSWVQKPLPPVAVPAPPPKDDDVIMDDDFSEGQTVQDRGGTSFVHQREVEDYDVAGDDEWAT